ncbi:histidinol-phosphate transaminase [Sutcliffiella rhizosphaerae]|uniref:Histidinol-phosphate aminotransferase n=1 Tax=Sutcliffiella rhizosphaerae TaxID=2880967 RepID=A0ABM8YRM6_9BACI|nr:histidinol-phosphate transaminase [Sutcliffiella rhizosphaerae]CAG9622647.1 Histidinol-phosphate aminotransferase [Sutcliffiella rhizosphaerae]
MDVKKQLLNLTPYQPGKPMDEVKRELGLERIVKLASNENPYGCSPKVQKAILEQLTNAATYPDGYARMLRETLASQLGVKEKQLIFGNGSDEVIQIISRALLSHDKNTVMPTPSFPQYKHNAVIEGAEIREVPLKNGYHQLDEMLRQIDEKTAIVWLCSPNNPTGTYINNELLISFLNQVPAHTLVVIDEAYKEYVTAVDYPESINLLKDYPNLLITRTFSKAYGLASFRIGYGIAQENLLQRIEPVREPFNTNSMAQAAATAGLTDQAFINECKNKNKEGLKQYYNFCEEMNLAYYKSEGNFILIDFQTDADELFQFLLKKGYIVRSGMALGFPTCLRITVGTFEQNNEIISYLREYKMKQAI